ncbi:hypothetical protein SELMODRAFT_420018 [Selaginella moellendorffii]|uniref:Dihydroxy-acid/6-phosphogluconate dehydratase N-terminal domain-containing protein n=1 Tax=Selaginella moellendorffii TaxID=88036 RepID=D8SAA4_SELML|nr:hypothetical protein SELMODRAFT_420018 [Selaginella moellendorffii]
MYIRQDINPTTNKILNARVVLVRILQNEVEQKERKRMNQERKKSRDFIADSIETVMGGQWYDANVSIPGCEMPGTLIAMGRLNQPSIMELSKSPERACVRYSVSFPDSYREYVGGHISDQQRLNVLQHSCPGTCGGMYTANTIEALGM